MEGFDFALPGSVLATIASVAGAWAVIRRQVAAHDAMISSIMDRLESIEHWRSRELGEARARARVTGPHGAVPLAEESGEH